jgi:hypothetical protein
MNAAMYIEQRRSHYSFVLIFVLSHGTRIPVFGSDVEEMQSYGNCLPRRYEGEVAARAYPEKR